jgi:hypothetical protein
VNPTMRTTCRDPARPSDGSHPDSVQFMIDAAHLGGFMRERFRSTPWLRNDFRFHNEFYHQIPSYTGVQLPQGRAQLACSWILFV